jgi:hypothetical protein
MRARTPHECVAIHSYALMSEEFVSTGRIPTYEAFLHAADLGPVYHWQKLFLQYLQLGCPKSRWVLKSPDHVYGMDKLLTVFPDAAIIQMHRNPVDVLRSQIQLTQVLEAIYARPVAPDRLGISEARKVKQISDYITRFRDAHCDAAEKFIDITYRELVSDPVSDPMEVVQRIYERLDIPLTARRRTDGAARCSAFALPEACYQSDIGIFRTRPRGRRERFAGYCSRFGIPC